VPDRKTAEVFNDYLIDIIPQSLHIV
jgi:hypothetical protein